MKRSLLLLSLLIVSLIPLSAQTTSPASSRSMLAKENLQEYFSVMFFDAAEAAEFNIVVDNIVAGYIGNRRLRQTIDYVKEQTNTGICVRCFINSDQRWAKVLNFKTPRGNCDTTNGTASIVFQIALSPLGTGKLAEYQPSISYRVVNGYDPQLKEENIEAFEKYLRDTLPPMTRKEFFPKLNNQLVTALLKLMGSNAAPVMVELKPQNAWGYDNYPAPAIYYSYEETQIHGKEEFVYWASIPKGQVLKIQGHVEQPLMDSTTTERMLQLKRNSSVQQNFSTKDSLTKFDVSGFSTGDNTVKAVYQLQEGKGVDILAGQLNVAAYKQEKVKLIIVPIKGTLFTDGTGLQGALDDIYRQAVVNWEVTVDNSFTYTQDVYINPESNSQDPYDNSMDKVIAAYKKTDGYSRKARILFLIDKFSSGLADEIGYMPFYDQFGFVKQIDRYGEKMTTGKLARWIAHELGHGAFGLRHTFDPQVGLAENYGNLMDYTDSTRLCKFQWDIIHDSDAGEKEFGSADEVMARSKDGKLYDLLQRIRCAMATQRTKVYMPFTTNDSENFYNFSEGKLKFVRANLRWKSKKTSFITIPATPPVSTKDRFMDMSLNALNYDFGDITITIPEADKELFESFMRNTNFNEEYNTLSEYLSANNSAKAVQTLLNSSYCVYELLTPLQRKQMLKALAEKFNLSEEYEDMVLNLLRSLNKTDVSVDDKKEVAGYVLNGKISPTILSQLRERQPKTLFECFEFGIDNWGGKDNYEMFIFELTKLYNNGFSDALRKAESGTNTCIYFDWQRSKGNATIKSREGEVELHNLRDHGLYFHCAKAEYMSNSHIVLVNFSGDFSFIGNQDKRMVAMPAFTLRYIINEYTKERHLNYLNNIMALFTFTKAVSALSLIGDATKVEKIKMSIDVVISTIGLSLTNKNFKAEIEKTIVGKEFLNAWDYFQLLYIAKGNISNFTKVLNNETFAKLSQLSHSWDIISLDSSIQKYIDSEKISKEIDKLKSIFSNEGVVY